MKQTLSKSDAKDLIEALPQVGLTKRTFTRVDDYTTFTAEYGIHDGDITVHFFLPRPPKGALEVATESATPEEVEIAAAQAERSKGLLQRDSKLARYWGEMFPAVLEPVVKDFFKAEPPRVQAAYTDEISSWWFKASGFETLDPNGLTREFLRKLDQALDAAGGSQTSSM